MARWLAEGPGRYSGAVVDQESFRVQIPAVLSRFGLGPATLIAPVAGGSLNWNYRVTTAEGPWFLRRYRDNLPTERIAGEHELIAWAAARGVPTPGPVSSLAHHTIDEQGEARWAVFPWVPGAVQPRGTLTAPQARALGETHGRVQATLARHPSSHGAPREKRWDLEASRAHIRLLIAAANRRGEPEWVIDGLIRQAELMNEWEVMPAAYFAGLPCQLLHGDFHDQQVIWQGDRIAAVIDWEIWHTDPRAWEVLRALAYSRLLDSPLLADYLAGYREHVALTERECRLGLRLWWQLRVLGLWAWSAYLLEGNDRVKEFLPSMVADLDLAADAAWRASLEERFVGAALERPA